MSAMDVIEAFKARLSTAIEHHNELLLAIHGKKREASLENLLVEQFTLSLAVLWEAFVNDVILAHISAKPQKLRAGIASRVKKSVSSKFGDAVGRRVSFESPHDPSIQQIHGMIDPKGTNITSAKPDKIVDTASKYLQAPTARKFSFNAHDRAFLDLFAALRDFLSHRSARSRSAIKAAVSSVQEVVWRSPDSPDPNLHFRVAIGQVGPYLKEKPDGATSRAVLCAHRQMEIAERLA